MSDKIRDAVGAVLFNASNYPEIVQPFLLGRDVGPLIEKMTAAVQAVLDESECRWFSAAYRARTGRIMPVGGATMNAAAALAMRDEYRREDPDGPEYFLASRIRTPWERVPDVDG